MRFNLTRPLYVYPLGLLGFVIVTFTLATLLLTFYHPGGVKHASAHESKPLIAADAAEQEKEHLLEREGVDVKIEKLGLTVSSRSLLRPSQRKVKVILAEVDASFPRGEVSVIMGPSGVSRSCPRVGRSPKLTLFALQAGKSSLLQILSSRLSGGLISDFSTSGAVLLNDQTLGPSTAGLVSFVQQEDDHHLPALTVRETLRYAAKLRLRGKTGDQCDARAEEVLKMLGLSPCADNIVGGEVSRRTAASRGNRADLLNTYSYSRVSREVSAVVYHLLLRCSPTLRSFSREFSLHVSAELELTFAPRSDEPLSGLDAFTARAVMETLKNLAIAGRTIVVSVHQPRGDIWEVSSTPKDDFGSR